MNTSLFTPVPNRYRSPRPYYNQPRPYGIRPHLGFQWRPVNNFGPVQCTSTENNEEYWCETCDRGFPTPDLLDRHKQQHEKCNIDGCQFVAHPKVITKHIQMQHSSGLYKKISKLDNPEEIKKWREERKKKYPTRVNIEKKAAEQKEKVERGEKMALKQDRKKFDKFADQQTGRKRNHGFIKNNPNHRTNNTQNTNQQQKTPANEDKPLPMKVPKMTPKVPKVVEKNKLKPFSGILKMSMEEDIPDVPNVLNCNNLIEEDEYNQDVIDLPVKRTTPEPVLCGALNSLMCDYGSSGDENEGKHNTINIVVPEQPPKITTKTKNLESNNTNGSANMKIININISEKLEPMNNKITTNCQTSKNEEEDDEDSGPEEIKTVKMDITEPPTNLEVTNLKSLPVNTKKNFVARNEKRHFNRYKPKVPSTLLQKLLCKEIRQERNIVLQCIRYIKRMNYFENPQE